MSRLRQTRPSGSRDAEKRVQARPAQQEAVPGPHRSGATSPRRDLGTAGPSSSTLPMTYESSS